jgi:glutamate decarboxylase
MPAEILRSRRAFRRQWQTLLALVSAGATVPGGAANAPSLFSNTFQIPNDGTPETEYFSRLLTDVLPFAAPVSSPRCFANMTSAVPDVLKAVAELALALNQNMVKREASGILTTLERQSLAEVHLLLYQLPPFFYRQHAQAASSTLGIFTAGGTSSNITALWVARNCCLGPAPQFHGIERQGIAAALTAHRCRRAVIIGSDLMHYSIDKAASLLGLGEEACIKVPVDSRGRIDLLQLRRTIAACQADGDRIVALVGVAGTTDMGSIDPLGEMADLAEEAGAHFHVDAAWGAPFLFSRRYGALLKGIERADSVTVDGHKQMHLPIANSFVLFRDPHRAAVIEKSTRYMLHPQSGDLGARSLEGSRACSGLLLHAALHLIGRRGYERWIEDGILKARYLAGKVLASDVFELLVEPETNIVVYRYVHPEWRAAAARRRLSAEQNAHLNAVNETIQREEAAAGQFSVSRTTLDYQSAGERVGVTALRVVMANPRTTETDIAGLLEEQAAIGRRLSQSSPWAPEACDGAVAGHG